MSIVVTPYTPTDTFHPTISIPAGNSDRSMGSFGPPYMELADNVFHLFSHAALFDQPMDITKVWTFDLGLEILSGGSLTIETGATLDVQGDLTADVGSLSTFNGDAVINGTAEINGTVTAEAGSVVGLLGTVKHKAPFFIPTIGAGPTYIIDNALHDVIIQQGQYTGSGHITVELKEPAPAGGRFTYRFLTANVLANITRIQSGSGGAQLCVIDETGYTIAPYTEVHFVDDGAGHWEFAGGSGCISSPP